MGKRKHVIWYHGKGKKAKIDDRDSPIIGEPDSYITFHDNQTGNLHRLRMLDEKGRAKKDFDRGYPNTSEPNDHAHDWLGEKRKRQRPLSKKERNFFNRKKRNLNKKGGRF